MAGVITTRNGLGRGLVLAVPNTVDQFKHDKKLVGTIMKNLKLTKSLTGAKTIAIAGQGPRFFKTHFPYEQPFVYGLKGRVFSVVETVEQVADRHGLTKNETTVAILGVGEIGAAIIDNSKRRDTGPSGSASVSWTAAWRSDTRGWRRSGAPISSSCRPRGATTWSPITITSRRRRS